MKGLVCGAYQVYAQKSRVTRVINVGQRHFSKGDDTVFFHIYLSPFSSLSDSVFICYANNTPLYTLRITGERPMETLTLGDDDRTFEFYPTYQLEKLKDGAGVILYVTLENNRITFDDDDTAPLIEPHVDLRTCVVPGVKFTQLPYIPLHPDDPLLEGRWLHEIPQRVPTWYVARGEGDVSGSNVNKYAGGYWLEDSGWSARSSSLMKFGRLNENNVQLIAMHNHQHWEFQECGTYVFQPPPPPPAAAVGNQVSAEGPTKKKIKVESPPTPPASAAVRYKASPDCLAIIPLLDWDVFPAATRARYSATCLPHKMVMEYKASYSSTAFPDYYIPQLYWEMMATGSAQACLIRYKKRRQIDPQGKWGTNHEAMEYHIFRDPAVEDMIVRNVRISTQQKPPGVTLKDWVEACPQPYKELQQVLKGVVERCKGRPLKIPKDLLDKAYKERKQYV